MYANTSGIRTMPDHGGAPTAASIEFITSSKLRRPQQAVILAGGRGTRMRPLTDSCPKALLPFHGKPFLVYMLEMLRDQGFTRVLLLLGYMPEAFQTAIGDGSALNLDVTYRITDADALTAHRLKDAEPDLDDCFLLLYCDNYWPMAADRMWERFVAADVPAMVTVYRNPDGYTRDSVRVAPDGFVEVFDRSRTTAGLKGVEISYAFLSKSVCALLPEDGNALVEDAIYPELTRQHSLVAYETDHRYYSVGSLARLPLTEEFFARRPAIFLDRDGVLNERPPRAEYVREWQEFKWLPGAKEALRLLRQASYRVIIISNQASIGRGLMSESELALIHSHMRAEAEEAGGMIDAIYVCPHHWNDGCECRKPKPGMLFQAQRDFHLDLSRTAFIGDDERDAQAARAAGCIPALVSESDSLLSIVRAMTDQRATTAS